MLGDRCEMVRCQIQLRKLVRAVSYNHVWAPCVPGSFHVPFDRKLAVRISGCDSEPQYVKALQMLQTVLGIK